MKAVRQVSKQGLLFLKKKKQKNFYFRRDLAPAAPAPAVSKSFFASFFSKKEALTCLFASLLLTGCSSERHFAADTLWPFGNPNRPIAASETAQRALGHAPAVTPISPQAGNVWPGAVQPVPTIADEEKAMNEPLGNAYTPSLPSPYPPGTEPPPNADLGIGPLGAPGTQTFAQPDDTGSGADGTQDLAPLTAPLPTAPSTVGGPSGGGSAGAGQ
jgi:hypothetical protein